MSFVCKVTKNNLRLRFCDQRNGLFDKIIELYFKLLLIEMHPEVFDEHFKFVDYDWKMTCCGQQYPEEFEEKFKNREAKYNQAHFVIDTFNKDVNQICDEIIGKYYERNS